MSNPKVSVVMPVYNGESYIREAAASILSQTFTDYELLIIDDGSSDKTPLILQELATNKKVRVLTNTSNQGLSYTRNRGIYNSKGLYIAMLDSDDIAYPNRLEKQVFFLDANPEYGLIGSWIDLVDSEGKYIDTQCYPTPSAYIPSLLLFQNNFAQSAVMIRKSYLPSEWYREDFPPAEDYDLWVRIVSNCKAVNLNSTLIKYRIHQASASAVKANVQRESILKIVKAQLEKIGITPTDDELKFHVQIGLLEIPKNKDSMNKAEKWLLKLVNSNKSSHYYPTQIFNCVIAKKWFEICRSSKLSFWGNIKLVSSPLFSLSCLGYITRLQVLCKVKAKSLVLRSSLQ